MTKLKYFLRDSSLDIFKPKHPISTQTDLKHQKRKFECVTYLPKLRRVDPHIRNRGNDTPHVFLTGCSEVTKYLDKDSICTQCQSKTTFCIINPIQHSSFTLKVLPDILVRRSSEFYLTDAIFTGYVRWTDGPSETLQFYNNLRVHVSINDIIKWLGISAYCACLWLAEMAFTRVCLRVSTSQTSFVVYLGFLYLAALNLPQLSWVKLLFIVTCKDISVICVTAHRCAGGLKKKLNLQSGSQRHRHFVGFLNVPVQAPTRGHPFYTVILRNRPI